MPSRERFVTVLACAVTVLAATSQRADATTLWPSCTPGVYWEWPKMCLDTYEFASCYDDETEIELCHEVLQTRYACDGPIVGHYCTFDDENCLEPYERLVCWVAE